MRASLAAVLLGALVVAPARVDAGACARPDIPTAAATAANTELAKGGGVVVTTEDSAKAPKLSFAKGGKVVAAAGKALGPGLVVYTPPSAGDWTLRDPKAGALVKVKQGTAAAKPLAAPKVNFVKWGTATGRRGTSTWVNVEIEGPPPAGAVLLVVLDDKSKIRSWGRLIGPGADPKAAKTYLNVFSTGSCTIQPNGFTTSSTGDKVQIAWLDASGTLSGLTAATVATDPPPPGNKAADP